jgi:hypothetical protein
VSEEQNQEKLEAFPYVIGGLSFIPLIGVLFGIIAIIWGLVTKKLGGKKLAIIGGCGVAFTIFLYSCLFYFGFVKRGGVYDDLRAKLSESNLVQLVQAIAFCKTQHGNYPESLEMLKNSLPENSMVFVYDASDVKRGGEPRYYHYELIDDVHYYLLGVGVDGQPFTDDDILPKIQLGPDSKVGLRIKSKGSL